MSAMRLINKKAVREKVLATAKQLNRARFVRVSTELLQDCEANLSAYIVNRVRSAPSKGKTL